MLTLTSPPEEGMKIFGTVGLDNGVVFQLCLCLEDSLALVSPNGG